MTTVLGTSIEPLPPDPRPVFLISDLHVPADGGAVFDTLRGAVAAATAQRARLVVLGDLFDSYVSPRQVKVGVWRDTAALFAAAVRAGVEIFLLHGNRDFLLGPEFAAASGVRIVAGGLRGTIAGVDTLLVHGDELCQNDLPYQRAKRWLRHPVTRWIARRLPLRLALALAERARRQSRTVVARGDQTRFLPTHTALGAAFATGAQRLVFGHIHRHAAGPFGAGEYRVLPAFDATRIGLGTQGSELRWLRFVDAHGTLAPVPDPASGEFAP